MNKNQGDRGHSTNSTEIPHFAKFDSPTDSKVMDNSDNGSKLFDPMAAAESQFAKWTASFDTATRIPSASMTSRDGNLVSPMKSIKNKSHTATSKKSIRTDPPPPVHFRSSLPPQHAKRSSSSSQSHPDRKQAAKTSKAEKRFRRHYANRKYTFQNPPERLDVSIRDVNLASRTAFERIRPIPIEEIKGVSQINLVSNASNDISLSSKNNEIKKISPSPQHLEILKNNHSVQTARQLCWGTSVSPEANLLNDLGESEQVDEHNLLNKDIQPEEDGGTSDTLKKKIRKDILLAEKRRKVLAASKSDGYTQVDPVGYISSTLPNHSPLLTNTRHRLPARVDVGFPGATTEQIDMKQDELRKEAELEEVSPRLIVMLGSAHIGLPSVVNENEHDELVCLEARQMLEYNIKDMPFAGKNLVTALRRHEVAFSLKRDKHRIECESKINDNEDFTDYIEMKPITNTAKDVTGKSKGGDDREYGLSPLKMDQTSIFSPPSDATFSSTQMWRKFSSSILQAYFCKILLNIILLF